MSPAANNLAGDCRRAYSANQFFQLHHSQVRALFVGESPPGITIRCISVANPSWIYNRKPTNRARAESPRRIHSRWSSYNYERATSSSTGWEAAASIRRMTWRFSRWREAAGARNDRDARCGCPSDSGSASDREYREGTGRRSCCRIDRTRSLPRYCWSWSCRSIALLNETQMNRSASYRYTRACSADDRNGRDVGDSPFRWPTISYASCDDAREHAVVTRNTGSCSPASCGPCLQVTITSQETERLLSLSFSQYFSE